MKKIVAIVLIAIVAIFAFLFTQINQFNHKIIEKLAQNHIIIEQSHLSFFPPLQIQLDQVNYQQFSAKKILANIDFLNLIQGKIKLNSLTFENANIANQNNSFHLKADFDELFITESSQTLIFNKNNQITLTFDKPLYANHKTFYLTFQNGKIGLNRIKELAFHLENTRLNLQNLGLFEAKWVNSNQLNAIIQPKCDKTCWVKLQYSTQFNRNHLHFIGENFPINTALTLLNFPNTLTGNTNFKIHLQFNPNEPMQGEFFFNAKNGEIIGVNLLDIISQFLPINLNQSMFENHNLNTIFDEFQDYATLKNNHLTISKLYLKTPHLIGEGQGEIDLIKNQCNILVNLKPNNEKYQKIALPIRFYDNCYSPQYKLEINRDFRNQIKNLIKEKLK